MHACVPEVARVLGTETRSFLRARNVTPVPHKSSLQHKLHLIKTVPLTLNFTFTYLLCGNYRLEQLIQLLQLFLLVIFLQLLLSFTLCHLHFQVKNVNLIAIQLFPLYSNYYLTKTFVYLYYSLYIKWLTY